MTNSDSNVLTTSNVEPPSEDLRKTQRWFFFDYIRAIGIILIIFIHGIVYHYGLIQSLDLENLNPFFMIIYVVLNWAGLFAFISAIVNTYSSFKRLENNFRNKVSKPSWKAFGMRWIFLGVFFLIMNIAYNYLVGPFQLDLATGDISHSLLPGLIRTGQFYSVAPAKILQGSVFSMLGWNLIIMGIFFTLLFKNEQKFREKRRRIILLILGIVIILISFLRIYLYDDFSNAIDGGNYFVAFLIDIVAGNYFPILPYLGFGLIGAYFGLILTDNPSKKKIRRLIWIGVGWIVAAIIAFIIPDSVYESLGLLDDIFFDYIIVMFEIGFFIVVGIPLLLLFFNKRGDKTNPSNRNKKKISTIFLRFSTNSLTFFLLERPISETFALILNLIIPGWNNYIWTCILYGLFLILFWFIIAFIWNLFDFKGSFEWLLLKFFKISKYQTDKKY
ncbi:MAG: hypothetical protein H7641_09745 [Candidatus Heimdallarchaeota archaeon]|nr:hypothetical protein [Candidatus Heimdallarchaeota archaeon]MCK4877844.1 hypothetical protein [Candidatus Heimdallarchaeota archaeon]